MSRVRASDGAVKTYRKQYFYKPKQMKKIWALAMRYVYVAEKYPGHGQAQFDKLHAYVDRGFPDRFKNRVRRLIGLPAQNLGR